MTRDEWDDRHTVMAIDQAGPNGESVIIADVSDDCEGCWIQSDYAIEIPADE